MMYAAQRLLCGLGQGVVAGAGCCPVRGACAHTRGMLQVYRITNAGSTIVRVGATIPWPARSRHCAVALPDGTVVMAAGTTVSKMDFNDVWRTSDEGETWEQAAVTAPWVARRAPGCTAVGFTMVLAGGSTGGTADLNDCWVSTDAGNTWTLRAAAAPWRARGFGGLVSLASGALVVLGGTTQAGIMLNDVWLSTDTGKTWSSVPSDESFEARSAFGFAVSRNQAVLVLGGANGANSGFGDVWRGHLVPGWHTENCTRLKPGLCEAPPSTTPVTVELPLSAAGVVPPNAPASTTFVVAAPTPALAAAPGPVAGLVAINASFSFPITGLAPADFLIRTPTGALVASSILLSGRANSWVLSLSLFDRVPLCPDGYTHLDIGNATVLGSCVRVVHTVGSWSAQNTACAPYTLTPVHSYDHLSGVVRQRAWPAVVTYWCAATAAVAAQRGLPVRASLITARFCGTSLRVGLTSSGMDSRKWADGSEVVYTPGAGVEADLSVGDKCLSLGKGEVPTLTVLAAATLTRLCWLSPQECSGLPRPPPLRPGSALRF